MPPDSGVQAWVRALQEPLDKLVMLLTMGAVLGDIRKYRELGGKLARGPGWADSGPKAKNRHFENT